MVELGWCCGSMADRGGRRRLAVTTIVHSYWSWYSGHGPCADGEMVAILGGAALPISPSDMVVVDIDLRLRAYVSSC
jgi:hypothetical protein